MSHEHKFACRTVWTGAARGPTTDYASYDRDHEIHVEGKPTLRASAAPAFKGNASLHNPEELLVAALSSCHMLSYLALAVKAHVVVEAYEDDATGEMALVDGAIRFTKVELRPRVTVATGTDAALAGALHEKAHHACFIANSVAFPVTNAPAITVSR